MLNQLHEKLETAEFKANGYSPAAVWFYLAMALNEQGHAEQADEWLDRASAWCDNKSVTDESVETWDLRLINRLLREEAALSDDRDKN